MFQQVNLYQPIFREERKLFSATAICTGLGIAAAGLVAITLVSWWQVLSLGRQLETVAAQERGRKNLNAASQHLFEHGETERDLNAKVAALAFQLDRRQRVLRYLASGAAGTNQGFATRLEALAREQIDGLWLKGATLTSEPGHFALVGSAVDADLVPRYLQRLAAEPALAGAKLDSLEILEPKSEAPRSAQDPTTAGRVDFSVSSQGQGTDQGSVLGMGMGTGKDPRLAAMTDAKASP